MTKRIEQVVVDKTRKLLNEVYEYPLPSTQKNEKDIIIYEQDGYKANTELKKLLLHGSKCSNKTKEKLWTDEADSGKPEFIIINEVENLAIVIECKVDIARKHISNALREKNILEKKSSSLSQKAVDGALHYAKFLSVNYDVIAVGVTGNIEENENVSELIITTYAWEKGKKWQEGGGPFININIDSFMTYDKYLVSFKRLNIIKKNMMEKNALSIAKELNELLHKGSVPPIERSLLISGLLLVLEDEIIVSSYKNKKIKEKKLLKLIATAIDESLSSLGVADTFKKEMLKTKFKDVFNQQGLLKNNARLLREVFQILEESVSPCMSGEFSLDIIGKFYSEFLRYAKGDKSSGIVLTPSHITELFCDLINLNIDDIILDPCAGTAGFLISAMNRLYELADKCNNTDELKENIKKNQLFGCDEDKQMFALGCSNMILRGDGKANMYYGSCFDNKEILSNKATVGMINPPYSGTDISCLEYVRFLCECIRMRNEKGEIVGKNRSRGDNLVCAIIPVSYMNSEDYSSERISLLKNNTLCAVISMPIELFRPVNTITCIVLLKAGIPHDPEVPTYLGNWKDDGYMWRKGIGRIPEGNRHIEIKEKWLKSYKRTIEDKNIGIWKCLSGKGECCWEKYAETDYSNITREVFEEEVKNFMLYKLKELKLSDLDEDNIEDGDNIKGIITEETMEELEVL